IMVNKIISALIGLAIVVAIIVGLIFRQTYTNITEEADFMEEYFSVALYDFDMSPNLVERMRTELPNSQLIVRVKPQGIIDYSFAIIKQYVEVLEVYQGNELEVGDQIGITLNAWGFYFDDMTANLNFVNFMQDDSEYLLFLEGKVDSPDPNETNTYTFSDLIIPGIFNYQDQDHTVIDVPVDDRYVPYKDVKDNEFFVSSEEALTALLELKHELLQAYPR